MNNEEKINFLKENYDVIAKKITHYDAAFRILENLVNNKVEHLGRLEQLEDKTQETLKGIMNAVQICLNTQLLLKDQHLTISVIIIFLAISLTVSSIDTIINAISSLVIVDGEKIIKLKNCPLDHVIL